MLTPRDYALDEVTVRGERPLVKVEGSRLTYDVAQIAASRLVTNAYEALLQLPGVVEKDGVPALSGSGSLGIVLNGKPSSMSAEQVIALLKATPASRVERAEVMYSAPPQYHVRGAAVNLVLKGYKAGEGGLQGEVNGNYAQKDEAGGNGGVTAGVALAAVGRGRDVPPERLLLPAGNGLPRPAHRRRRDARHPPV